MEIEVAFNKALEHIHSSDSLTKEESEKINGSLEILHLSKKEILWEPGQIASATYFIAEGCMRSYYFDEKGAEVTVQLGIEDWWISDLYSFLSGKPSRLYLQALEPTTLVSISKSVLESLYYEIPALSHFFRKKIQAAYMALQERLMDNLSVEAYERYVQFRKQYRDIEQRIPQYVVASYLGVTPEFLSALRKKHSKTLS